MSCEKVVAYLKFQAFVSSSPKDDHRSPMIEYGMPSGPGDESQQVWSVFLSSSLVKGAEIALLSLAKMDKISLRKFSSGSISVSLGSSYRAL